MGNDRERCAVCHSGDPMVAGLAPLQCVASNGDTGFQVDMLFGAFEHRRTRTRWPGRRKVSLALAALEGGRSRQGWIYAWASD
jgi:hypothetical protein